MHLKKFKIQNNMKLLNTLLISFFLIGSISYAQTVGHSQPVSIPKPPSIDANSYILMDFNSETLLAEFDINKRVEPASITKMMTAFVVFSELKSGNLQLSDKVTVSEKAWRTGGSKNVYRG